MEYKREYYVNDDNFDVNDLQREILDFVQDELDRDPNNDIQVLSSREARMPPTESCDSEFTPDEHSMIGDVLDEVACEIIDCAACCREDDYDDRSIFADPGGRSALRAASPENPRDQPCPQCGAENVLTPADVALGYCCDRCADQNEGGI